MRAQHRPERALYLSSPIGLGHARRDLAIAQELRRDHPELQIDWLAQHPVTRVLAEAGETIHPASHWLASESAHVEDDADVDGVVRGGQSSARWSNKKKANVDDDEHGHENEQLAHAETFVVVRGRGKDCAP